MRRVVSLIILHIGCNLFPNPASDNYVFAYYDLRHKNIPATLKLYDLQGKLVAQTLLQTHKNSQTITIGHLPNGLFIYQFEQNGEIIRSGKLLKQPYR